MDENNFANSGSCTVEQLSQDKQVEISLLKLSAYISRIDKITKSFSRHLLSNEEKREIEENV